MGGQGASLETKQTANKTIAFYDCETVILCGWDGSDWLYIGHPYHVDVS